MKKILERIIFISILVVIGAGGMQLIGDAHQQIPSNLREAMSVYESGEYERAIELLLQADGDSLAIGNAYFHAGELKEDPQTQMALYQEALDAYEEGIVKMPQRVDLKYNYEYVKALMEDQQDQSSEDNQEKQEDSQEGQEDDQKGQEDQNGEDQEASDRNQDQGDGDRQQGSDDSRNDSGSENQEQNSDQSQSQNSQGQDGVNQEDGQSSQKEEDSENSPDEGQGKDGQGQLSDEELSQILKLLESQEGESLKNNQEVIQGDHGDGNDW